MTTLYGIKNCDTVKKARRWLEQRNIDYHFHDFREDGLDAEQLNTWLDELGWEQLVNRRSTSWKALPQDVRDSMDRASAAKVVIQTPTLIKRPLLDTGSMRYVGFTEQSYAEIFTSHTL
mgnify:CR=1 FL=1